MIFTDSIPLPWQTREDITCKKCILVLNLSNMALPYHITITLYRLYLSFICVQLGSLCCYNNADGNVTFTFLEHPCPKRCFTAKILKYSKLYHCIGFLHPSVSRRQRRWWLTSKMAWWMMTDLQRKLLKSPNLQACHSPTRLHSSGFTKTLKGRCRVRRMQEVTRTMFGNLSEATLNIIFHFCPQDHSATRKWRNGSRQVTSPCLSWLKEVAMTSFRPWGR